MYESSENIRQAVNKLLSVTSRVKRKRQTKQIQNRELFVSVVTSIQLLASRANIAYADLKLDFSTYDEPFLEIIDALLLAKYGEEACELISFYLWERENSNGTYNEVFDEEDNPIPLDSVIDLWNIITKLNPDIEK